MQPLQGRPMAPSVPRDIHRTHGALHPSMDYLTMLLESASSLRAANCSHPPPATLNNYQSRPSLTVHLQSTAIIFPDLHPTRLIASPHGALPSSSHYPEPC